MGNRVTLAAGCIAALLIAGCGDDTKTVDHTTLEKAIEISIARQRHEIVIVACPKGIKAEKGKKFNCTATRANGEQVKFRVTVKDDKGNLRYAGLHTKSK
ncbi:MAG: DUF4333 domain-containing protein [Thermoleophilaceae bacterium]